jgi:hypothetical protein
MFDTGSRPCLGHFSDSNKKIGFECRRNQFNPGIAAWFSSVT